MTLQVGFAYRAIRRDSVAVVVQQEGGKGEVVLGGTVLENLATKVSGVRAFGDSSCHPEGQMCSPDCICVGSLAIV